MPLSCTRACTSTPAKSGGVLCWDDASSASRFATSFPLLELTPADTPSLLHHSSALTLSLRKHPFALFGLPFIATIVAASWGLSNLTQTRYDLRDEKVHAVSKEEELHMKKDRRKFDVREEYFVSAKRARKDDDLGSRCDGREGGCKELIKHFLCRLTEATSDRRSTWGARYMGEQARRPVARASRVGDAARCEEVSGDERGFHLYTLSVLKIPPYRNCISSLYPTSCFAHNERQCMRLRLSPRSVRDRLRALSAILLLRH